MCTEQIPGFTRTHFILSRVSGQIKVSGHKKVHGFFASGLFVVIESLAEVAVCFRVVSTVVICNTKNVVYYVGFWIIILVSGILREELKTKSL